MKTTVMRRDILEPEYTKPETRVVSAVCEGFLCLSTTVTVEEEVTEDEYVIQL